MEEFWGASKAFFVEKWAYIYYNLGNENFFVIYILGKLSPLTIIITINNILGTSVVGTIAYVSTNLVFGIIDLNASPQIIKKYKIQDTKNFPVRIPVHVYSFAYCFNFYPFLTG